MLLDDIIDIAVGKDQPVSVLLRKCLLLAHQLKNERLKAWANQELNGYATEENLPQYRIVGAQALGDFSGYGGASVRNWGIPPALLEKNHRQYATTVHLTQAIGAYEDFVTKGNGSIHYKWPPNLVLLYHNRIQ
jgi:hypothetical protein